MKNLIMIYNKTEKKHLGIIILFQSILVLFLIVGLIQNPSPNLSTQAQQSAFSEEITRDAKVCLRLDPSERPVCAKIAGAKIGQHFSDPVERMRECLKFRPNYVHDCQLGLTGE